MPINIQLTPKTIEQQKKFAYRSIAILLVDHPEEVKGLLREYGYETSEDPKKLGVTLNKGMHENPSIKEGVIQLIVNTGVYNNYHNQTGETTGGFDPVSAVSNALSSVIGLFTGGKERQTQEQISRDRITQEVIKYQSEQTKAKQTKMLIYGGIALGVLLIGGLIIAGASKK